MLQVQIPKDIREYEPKFIGPFTMRQCLSIISAAVIELAGSKLMEGIFKTPRMEYIVPLIIAAPILFFGFGDQMLHMKPEVYIREVFIRNLVYPKIRPYKTHNFIEVQINEIQKEQEMEASNKKDNGNTKKGKKKEQKRRQEIKNLPDELEAYN